MAEDQPMPAQPLLPARRPRADNSGGIADPGVAVEAPADVVPVAPPAGGGPVQAGLPVPAAEAPSVARAEVLIAPASKKARTVYLPPVQQPMQPMPQLQSSTTTTFLQWSPSALEVDIDVYLNPELQRRQRRSKRRSKT